METLPMLSIPDSPYKHATTILTKYYGTIKSLRGHLEDVLENSTTESLRLSLAKDNDTDGFLNLLDSSLVAAKECRNPSLRICSPMMDMHEVLDQAQSRLFKLKRPQNIITSGYRIAQYEGDRGRKGMARVGITNFFINTMINAFYGPEWETLLSRIGEDAMIYLLTETSIFLTLPNGCLCQIVGEPLIHLPPNTLGPRSSTSGPVLANPSPVKKRPCPDIEGAEEQSPRKRQKIEGMLETKLPGGKGLQVKRVTPAGITFSRLRLFYSRPSYVPHTNNILVGLPVNHILNRLAPSFRKVAKLNSSSDLDDPREVAKKTRHLSKYIFARQYGLSTPFSLATTKSSNVKLGDYLDRESELKAAGTCKTPNRLKGVLSMLEKLLRRHVKCGYMPLRDKSCPSKVKIQGEKDIDSSVILELMSETSVQLRSQISFAGENTSLDSAGNKIVPFGLTQARNHAKTKARFAEFSCNHVEVYRYIVLVTNAVIPKSFWGSDKNLKVVLGYVKEFITCRRYETLHLHHVLQNLSTSDCDWLMPSGPGARQQARVSVSDMLKRRELLEDFIFWYFDSFVLPLLKTTFYITESSAFRNQVLYFRHDDWATLCAPLIERLTSVTFEKLPDAEASEILRQRRLGFSFVRLLPKETGVRPIVNLRRRNTMGKGSFATGQSINQILQAAFNILTFEKTNQPHLLGVSIFNPDGIYKKLKNFKAALPERANGILPKLYFVKLDVQACFDTIDQTKLLQILRQIISEDVYMIQKYGQVSMTLGKIKRAYVKKAVPEDDHPHFLRYAADLANALRNTIFVDQVVYPLSKKLEVLQLLEEHITENIVKIGRSYYRQTVGIPQGSVLSTILCSFFYGDLENKFSKYTDDKQSVMLRMVDDYLYVTTNLANAKGFLEIMKKGHPEYGCFISQDKTLTNFDHGDGSLNVVDPSQKSFPWCGFSIGMRDLSISVDYTRYYGSGIRSTLTIERGRRPGVAFAYKLMQLANAKSHAIFSDRELNSEHVVYLNIYQNFLLAAMKMHEYLRAWALSGRTNYSFLQGVIQKVVLYSYTSIRSRATQKGSNSAIRKDTIVWLGNHAFHHVLSRKASRYAFVLRWLQHEIRNVKCRRYLHKFKMLVKEGQLGLAQIPS